MHFIAGVLWLIFESFFAEMGSASVAKLGMYQ
jgi:hypothetical protein